MIALPLMPPLALAADQTSPQPTSRWHHALQGRHLACPGTLSHPPWHHGRVAPGVSRLPYAQTGGPAQQNAMTFFLFAIHSLTLAACHIDAPTVGVRNTLACLI
jgi:hypothetical protein